MNQLFLSNPDLAEEIKFDKLYFAEDFDLESPKLANLGSATSPKKGPGGGIANLNESFSFADEPNEGKKNTGKFWGAISREMTKTQKNSGMPSLNQVNHILNIYKMKFETKEDIDKKEPAKRKKSPSRKKEKQKPKEVKPPAIVGPQNTVGLEDEEDGVRYFSFRKKIHLQFKQRRLQMEREENKRRKELEAEREKLAKENLQKAMMTTLAELDTEIMRNKVTEENDRSGDGTSRANAKLKNKANSRENSLKPQGNIFDRLTKDMNAMPEEEEDPLNKKVFLSQFAKNLYREMKNATDLEVFKKNAQIKIANYKRDYRDKISKMKPLPTDSLRFNKEKTRYLNMFMPDFDKVAAPPHNKDAVFMVGEVARDTDEWIENPEFAILGKFQKIRAGNMFSFWQDTKDLNLIQ